MVVRSRFGKESCNLTEFYGHDGHELASTAQAATVGLAGLRHIMTWIYW